MTLLPPDLSALFQQAVAAHRAGRLDEAEPLYRRILARQPALAEAQANLGFLLGRTGAPARGAERLRRAVALAPGDPRHLLALAEHLLAAGEAEAAVPAWEQALRLDPAREGVAAALARTRRQALFQSQTLALLGAVPGAAVLARGVAERLARVGDHYDGALAVHGATPSGVSVPDEAYHDRVLRLLARLAEEAGGRAGAGWTVNDMGCGYGALFDRLAPRLTPHGVRYQGYDISPAMVGRARARLDGDPRAVFALSSVALWPADCTVAAGPFNFTLDHDRADWLRYVQAQLLHMARLSRVAVVASFLWRDRPNLFGLPPDELLPFVRSAVGGRAEVLGDPADPEWVLRVFTGPQN